MNEPNDMAAPPSDLDRPVTLGILGDLVGYHLRIASGAMRIDFQRALDGTGMRQVLFAILSVIAANPAISQGTVGRVLGIQRANMVALINELVDSGLIARRVAAHDRRAFALEVTARGVTMVTTCQRRIVDHETAMLSTFSDAERAVLIDLLCRITAHQS